MIIKLYKNKSEKNKIDKELVQVAELVGTLRDSASIMKPVICIEYNNPTNFNYVHIDSFNRFYFVDDIVVTNKKLLTMTLSVDVLESFKTQIKKQKIIMDKNTEVFDKYLPDENLKINVKTKTDIVNFPNGFLNSGEFILITAGG